MYQWTIKMLQKTFTNMKEILMLVADHRSDSMLKMIPMSFKNKQKPLST